MDTEFAFLRELETDLTSAAHAEQRQMAAPSKPRRRAYGRAVLGVAAAVLALAFAVGVLAQGSGVRSPQFSSVGAAVGGPGNGTESQLGVGGSTPAPAASQPPLGYGDAPASHSLGQTLDKNGALVTSSQADLSKIIRNGSIAVTIEDGSFRDQYKQVFAIAGANGGSVLSSSTAGGDSGSFTLRIPAADFDKAMLQLSQLGTVDASEIHGQDVTADYIDAKAHLKIYTSRRAVLYGLMDQATTIPQTLVVTKELESVQLNIDQITGQLRYLNNQVAESTIKVDIHEPDAATATTDDIRNPSLGRALDRAVQGVMNVMAAVLIGLGYLLPLLVIVGIVSLVVWMVRRRSRRTIADG